MSGLIFLSLYFQTSIFAQDASSDHDTTYYEAYPDLFVARGYYSKKFTGFNVDFPELQGTELRYVPNTTNNIGIGATYKWATLNLAYGFSFMNPDRGEGKTSYLDLQTHQYSRTLNIDMYGQFYRGYYLKEKQGDEFYVRPDLRVNEFGFSIEHIFNYDKYSFRAAFLNTEYQKKSAGTWLLGLELFFGSVRADSSLIPYFFQVEDEHDYEKLDFFKAGPKGGYAVNIVLNRHFFFTLAATVGLGAGFYNLESDIIEENNTYLSADLGIRSALGYNSRKFTFGIYYVLQNTQVTKNNLNILRTGNIRGVLAYRFIAPEKIESSRFFQ